MANKRPRFDWDSEKFGVPQYNTKKLLECIEKEDGGLFEARLKDRGFNKSKNNFYMRQ